MPSYAVGTSATMIQSSGNRSIAFDLHADADNTDTVNVSTSDPSVSNPEEEMVAGQTITFSKFRGTLWAKSESGTQTLSVFGATYDDTEIVKA